MNPFVGREDILSNLDEWLFDVKAKPNLLLAGQAGRGKSTLLVQWLDSLRTRGLIDYRVIIIPISQIYGIDKELDFFPALAAELAAAFPVLGQEPEDIEKKRIFAQASLQTLAQLNISLLLLVDGLDEANGWVFDRGIFPLTEPGSALRIVASARLEADDSKAVNWLMRVGWERNAAVVTVGPLADSAVSGLYARASEGRYTEAEIAGLVKVTNGEPLVARLLVAELASAEYSLPSLVVDRAKDALSIVMRFWVDRLYNSISVSEREAVTRLLGVLSAAHGSLSRKDLARIMNLTFASLDQAIKSARTIIAGDPGAGYVLAHPSLAEALKPFLVIGDDELQKGFVRLLSETLENARHHNIESISSYVVDHAAEHVWQAGSFIEDCTGFLGTHWMQAVHHHTGSTGRFYNFVKAVQVRARQENAKAALRRELIPFGTVEMLCVFWKAVATEFELIFASQSKSSISAAEVRLEKMRVKHGDPGFPILIDYEKELRQLLELREQISFSLMPVWQSITDHIVDDAARALFCGIFDTSAELVSLVRLFRPNLDLEAHISGLQKPSDRIVGLLYLLDSAVIDQAGPYVDRINVELSKHKSAKLRASTFIELACRNYLTIEQAIKEALAYAAQGYEEARSSIEWVAYLVSHCIEARGDTSCLEHLYSQFISVPSTDHSMCIPLQELVLRYGSHLQREKCLIYMYRHSNWDDFHLAVRQSASAWDFQVLESLCQLFEAECNEVQLFQGDAEESVSGKGLSDHARHMQHVSTLFAIVAFNASGDIREKAFSIAVSFFSKYMPSCFLWASREVFEDLIEDVLLNPAQNSPETYVVAGYLDLLIRHHEKERGEPWSNWSHAVRVWKLTDRQALVKIQMLVSRWGDAALLNCDCSGLSLEVLESLRHGVLAEADSKVTATGLKKLDAEINKRLAKELQPIAVLRYPVVISALAKLLAQLKPDRGAEGTDAALELILNAEGFGWPALYDLTLPEQWEMPPILQARLVGVLSRWDIVTARYSDCKFPYALAGIVESSHLPWAFIHDRQEPIEVIAHIGELLMNVKSEGARSELESIYLTEVQKDKTGLPKVFSMVRYTLSQVEAVYCAARWVEVIVAVMQCQKNYPIIDIMFTVLINSPMSQHPEIWLEFCKWGLQHVDEIDNDLSRIQLRDALGLPSLESDKAYCRSLLKRASITTEDKDLDYQLSKVLRLLLANCTDSEVLADVDRWVDASTDDNFLIRVEALAENLTHRHLRVLAPLALHSLTFTGRSRNSSLIFDRFPKAERDVMFFEWSDQLAGGKRDDYRRFLRAISAYAGSAFSCSVLKTILTGAEIDYWEEFIIPLYERLNPTDALLLIDPLFSLVVANTHKDLALELLCKLPVSELLKLIRKFLQLGLSDAELAMKKELYVQCPQALAPQDVRGLKDKCPWLFSCPGFPNGSVIEKDREWSLAIAQSDDSITLGETIESFSEVLRLYSEFGQSTSDLVAAVHDAATLVNER